LKLFSRDGYSRNYWALALEGSCFMGGIAVIAAGGSVSLFINTMTGSKTLVGLAVTISTLCMQVGQLFSAPYVRSIRDLPGFFIRVMSVQRAIPILIAIPLFLGMPGNIAVGIFMILYAIFWIVDGSMAVPWGELCMRTLTDDLRGHMMGMQVTIGGAASLFTGLLLRWLLATPVLTNHLRFALIFVLASVVMLFSVVFMRMVKDPHPVLTPQKPKIREYYARVPSVVRGSKPLQHMLIARAFSYVGFSCLSFLVVFGSGVLKLPESLVSWLVYANIAGGLIGGIVLGEISRRFGNKTVIMTCNVSVLITLCMAASLLRVPSLGYVWLFATCALASLTMGCWVGYFNYILDIAPSEDRSVFQVVNTWIGIPFSFAGYAMGAVIDNFGYGAMFMTGGSFVVVTILLSMRLMSKRRILISAGGMKDIK